MSKTHNRQTHQKWYMSHWLAILMLIFFAPVGIYLVWRYVNWSRGWRIASTVAATLFFGYVIVLGINAPPTITIDNVKNGRIETEDASYKVTGSIAGADSGTMLKVNDKPVQIDRGKYSADVDLQEGENTIIISANKKDKIVQESIIIYRFTAEEIQARKDSEAAKQRAEQEAEAKRRADAEEKRKADAEAEEAKKSETENKPSEENVVKPDTKEISRLDAERACQDANFLQNYVDISDTSIVTFSYKPYFTDMGDGTKSLQWNGKDKPSGNSILFVCDVAKENNKVVVKGLAIDGVGVYGTAIY